MKRLLIPILSLAFIVVVLILSSFQRKCHFTGPTRVYTTLEQARSLISHGWLPDSLPSSAHNIREKRDFDANRIIAAFSFNPDDDIALMIDDAEELPGTSLQTIKPAVICRRDSWFPAPIIEGKFDKLAPQGFHIYEVWRHQTNRIISGKIVHWYLVLHRKAGICYLWN